jgi:hypothetical protein
MDVTLFRKIILANELGGDRRFIYRFSDPDGPAGRSGYSFGLCQFDIAHNPAAILCLRECGFTTDEIAGLKSQSINPAGLESKLIDNDMIIDKWDNRQLAECLNHPLAVCRQSSGLMVTSKAMYHLADYHNQFYMSRGGKMHKFLLDLHRPVLSQDILDFKLTLSWGLKRPDDVCRRYKNIVDIIGD